MKKSIYRITDEFGPLEVLDDGAKRYLTFGNEHEQSCQIKAQPHIPQHEYSRAITLCLLFIQPKRIGIMGLGGGTLAMTFLHACPEAEVHAIELRQEVIRVAQKFFQLPKHETRLYLTHQDAFEYVQSKQQSFDILIADLYHHHGIDEIQLQKQFIKNCSEQLSEDGWLVLNYWLDHDLNHEVLKQLDEDFSCVYACNSGGGNIILLAGKQYPKADVLSANNVKPLAKKLGFSLNYYLKRLTLLNSV